ncbi:MAG: RNA polymerase sigma factor [Bacillota bacterium]|nr:RNA polymerase sigma factor [Bacillota bacterium]
MSDCNGELIEKAVNGDKQALEKLISGIKDKIYNLSLRMLWNPSDAEDATQEILIKVITNLSKFRLECKFSTWVYSIASNHLININKRGLEKQDLSFEIFEKGIEAGFDTNEPIMVSDADRNILAEELKVSCTHAMLLCLDRESRMIYILSSMFGINSNEGAFIMNITPETYRKRLSRIREKMRSFMENNCGLVNKNKPCRCNRRVEVAIESRRINPENLIFIDQPLAENGLVGACKEEMEEFDKVSAVFTSNPYYLTPDSIFQGIKKIITSGNYKILQG